MQIIFLFFVLLFKLVCSKPFNKTRFILVILNQLKVPSLYNILEAAKKIIFALFIIDVDLWVSPHSRLRSEFLDTKSSHVKITQLTFPT